MKFAQSSPLLDYRKNLVLHALLKIDEWKGLTQAASWPLYRAASEILKENDKLAETVNSIATYYLEHEPIVPLIIVDLVIEELQKSPISYDEILQVMDARISEVLCLQS